MQTIPPDGAEVPWAPGYFVCPSGDVWSTNGRWGHLRAWKLKPRIGSNGYLRLLVYASSGRKYVSLHRLVAEVLLPNPDGKPEVRHKDGNALNCAVENLAWSTRAENCADTMAHGRLKYGEANSQAKLNPDSVREIRRKHLEGQSMRSIARDLGVTKAAISGVVHGRTWVHVK